MFVWSDIDGNSSAMDSSAVKVLHDQTIDWRFDDWRTMREVEKITFLVIYIVFILHLQHVSLGQHSIGLQFIGKPWEQLRSIPVDREGEYVFSLRPRTRYPNRLLCEVKVVDNVKVITIRSTYKIENLTLYPLELTLVDDMGHPVYSMEKIAPGEDYSLPIEAVTQNKVRIQPDRKLSITLLVNFYIPRQQKDLATNGALLLAGRTSSPRKLSVSSALMLILGRLHFVSKHGFIPILMISFHGAAGSTISASHSYP